MRINIVLIAMLCIANTWFLLYINKRLTYLFYAIQDMLSAQGMLLRVLREMLKNREG